MAALAAGAALALGAAAVVWGIATDDLARSIGGGSITLTAGTLLALAKIRVWCTDTRAERQRLADLQRLATDERTRLVAAQGALEQERNRVLRDAAAAEQAAAVRLVAAKAAMEEQLEEERAQMAVDSLNTAFKLIKAGLLNPRATRSNVLHLIQQASRYQDEEPQAQPTRERGVGHPAH
ncbi:hypothetical protein ACFXD5_06850 [Streptomyces sp. NPDC059385]|uniref:hypothetical protein n=1 Tax=Streptomyces sp. NPDC059385 TaxID=3346817 RepID=UPI0036A599BA